MGTKVKKGILKPFRYFSQIFDSKEPEMQIGAPTDVKHVAHIGWDGPNVNSPSWMKDYHSAPLASTGANGIESPANDLWSSQDREMGGESPTQPTSVSTDAPRPRHSRRHQSDHGPLISGESPNRESTQVEGTKKTRRPRKKESASTTATDAASGDMPAIPKQSQQRRKSKQSSSSMSGSTEGSVRASKVNKPRAGTEETNSNKQLFSLDD